MRHITLDRARQLLLPRAALDRERWSDRQIAAGIATGSLRRLQRGQYVSTADWEDLWPESRHLIEVAAAFTEMRDGGAVASYVSAAAIWGLPLYRHVPTAVRVTIPGGKHVSSRTGLRRHCDTLPDSDITVRDGIRTTTLERTAFDLARTLDFPAAVASTDAALRQVSVIGREYDHTAAEEWRERMRRRVTEAKGARRIRQASRAIEFADARAESPTESVARLHLVRIGFARIALQVPVPSPRGTLWWVDLELENVGAFLEIDGAGKYEDEALRSGRTLSEVLLEEKRREDWIRGTTQKRFARAETAHVKTPEALARRLASFGIHPPS